MVHHSCCIHTGPCVSFDASSLGFGQVKSGGIVTRILNIANESDVNTAFQVRFIHLYMHFSADHVIVLEPCMTLLFCPLDYNYSRSSGLFVNCTVITIKYIYIIFSLYFFVTVSHR